MKQDLEVLLAQSLNVGFKLLNPCEGCFMKQSHLQWPKDREGDKPGVARPYLSTRLRIGNQVRHQVGYRKHHFVVPNAGKIRKVVSFCNDHSHEKMRPIICRCTKESRDELGKRASHRAFKNRGRTSLRS